MEDFFMKIVVDAFGGDNAPLEIVKGASDASIQFKTEITLTGNKQEIQKIINENNLKFFGELIIIDTDDVISMHDDPTTILKAHSNSSMALAFKELSESRADAFVSADFKYHELQSAYQRITVVDMDHWVSEHFTRDIFAELLSPYVQTHIAVSDFSPVQYGV